MSIIVLIINFELLKILLNCLICLFLEEKLKKKSLNFND